ncbi:MULTISPECIES: polysaccharide lyase family 7 protein [unclassified Shewanella]|uniref:polysaccharide lyase family 7 protein n=1 Tax=unclassified Shewanella TaxID=196818 RepID=UPI000C867AB1|nr:MULTISPECIES: polysaccharide lyase family 7 protein [unclassified Shewanella]MDO6620971.1 polysaccharide lyase family 7 protein [Shewanella sp. 6_MG-2023]MDO6641941.1 polysaccharide lyase family 7 protein [Shewanella sp. 5_MG-2023]MDO6680401.1 polysaccharide lyase family 7 protein [Shewanella sp. 4_MG-2023]MDO6777416.1 polysaccharide lyase family 7 protein [Shewanella sp. 3_MG-2023]PMG31330.1 alginate lyase [Shewanella sp. 10N.286.52.C2]
MKKLHLSILAVAILAGCSATSPAPQVKKEFNYDLTKYNLDATKAPAQNFDLTKWKITLPELTTEGSRKGKALEINRHDLGNTQTPYVHPEWFYTDPKTGALVFVAPNEAPTTPNSKNTRSELRGMLAEKYDDPKTNFVIASHPDASEYGAIGGQLKATLAVDQVSTSGEYRKNNAFAVVIGQIHGSDNEPLKILYRKLPGHEFGSLSWNYELNPIPELQDARDSNGKKLRKDIRHNVFGTYNLREHHDDPQDGIRLGEIFSYEVNVEGDIMKLTFTKNPGEANEIVKTFDVNLAEGNYQGHEVDQGYQADWMYYKAGVYNQCNTKASSSNCEWRGMEAGDYAQASFYELELNQ